MRTLPIDGDTLGTLRQYASSIGLSPENTNTPIFGLNKHRAWQIVRNSAKRAELPDLVNTERGRKMGVSPHRLRDAFSVHAVKSDDSGDALRLLREHLGHASFNTTAKYRKIAGEEHRQWYDRLWERSVPSVDLGEHRVTGERTTISK